jgi:putative DNA primase/helicase
VDDDEPSEPKDNGEDPPVRLSQAALKRWHGEIVERKENGEIDRSRSLTQIAWTLARAGASERIIREAIRNRDKALGFRKYVTRRDNGKAYRDLANKVYRAVDAPEEETGGADKLFKPTSHLNHSLKNLPEPGAFPVDALPEGCRQLVREGSETIGCPPDFLAAPMLAALGSAIGVSHVIEIIQGWTEAPTLWVATVGHPGARKTPPAREAKKPVAGYQARLRKEYREQLKRYEQEERDDPPEKAAAYVDDITTESLIVTLDESPRGVIQFKDELLGLIRGLDQYKGGRGSDRQFYLSGWSGEPYAYRRKGTKEDVLLSRPFLSVVGSIQTDLLHEIADGREDGLADRFIYIFPDRVRSRLSEEQKGITDQARKSYAALYMRLRELDFAGEDEYGRPEPRVVKASPDARQLLREQINALRDEAELPGFPSRLEWVWPKQEANLARLALILALSRCVNLRAAGQEVPWRVEGSDLLRAMALLDHFKRHLRRVYALLYKADPKDRVIEDVARHLMALGGSWSGGTATDFHCQLESENKPKRPDELAKIIKDRAESRGDLSYQTKHVRHVKEDGTPTTRQIVRIDLLS